jgi:hypothetical protein
MQSSDDAVAEMALRVVREVENAGRQQIINSIESEPDELVPETTQDRDIGPDVPNFDSTIRDKERGNAVRGWARIATGRETCEWCMMLVSRGPVYTTAAAAGLQGVSNTEAQRLFRDKSLETYGSDITASMEQWHDGCDCKVIPVFDRDNWVGNDASWRAYRLWQQAGEETKQFIQDNPGRVHPSGKKKGQKYTFSEEVINTLRRKIYHGEIRSSDYAALKIKCPKLGSIDLESKVCQRTKKPLLNQLKRLRNPLSQVRKLKNMIMSCLIGLGIKSPVLMLRLLNIVFSYAKRRNQIRI